MITVGQQYRYIAWQGTLAHRCNQIVTALRCHRARILVRFPDGLEADVQPRFLREIDHAN